MKKKEMYKRSGSSGMGFVSTLTLIFIVLKLTGALSWPWLWVLSPVWISLSLMAVACCFIRGGGRIVKGNW